MEEFFKDFVQGIIAHWLYLVLLPVGAVMLGVAKIVANKYKKCWPLVANLMMYAVVGAVVAFILILLLGLTGQQVDQMDRILAQTDQQSEMLEKLTNEQTEALDKLTNAQVAILENLASDKFSRPYFTLVQAKAQENSASKFVLILSVKNNDIPAENVASQLLIFDEFLDPTIEPVVTNRIEDANAKGPGSILIRESTIRFNRNKIPRFGVFQIRYKDALRDGTYSQEFYLKFSETSQDGKIKWKISSAKSDEKTKMMKYISARNIPML